MADQAFIEKLNQRMAEQAARAPVDLLFAFNRNGLRAAIAAIEDETRELYDEWRENKRKLGTVIPKIRHELLDIAAVAMLAYQNIPESSTRNENMASIPERQRRTHQYDLGGHQDGAGHPGVAGR